MALKLERINLRGELLTCVEKNTAGRCLRYMQTCDGDDCITDSPAHPDVPGRTKGKRRTKKASAKPAGKKTGKTDPWRMSKAEWEKAVDATHPGTPFASKSTKSSGAELAQKLTEHLRLNYNAAIVNSDTGQAITTHKLVIAKAFSEGKKIPNLVLDEYPDIAKFVKSPEYQRDRKARVDSIEEDAKRKRQFEAEKKLLKIDTVYDTDLETSIQRVLELKPTVNYYLRAKSPKRTYVDSSTPFRGQSYVMVDKDWTVRRFDSEHRELKGKDLGLNDRVYNTDILETAEILSNLPSDRRRGQTYYLTRIDDTATKVESKTPGGTGPYIRVDYRGVAHFDENRKLVSDPTSDEEGAAYLNAERDYMSCLAGDLLTCNRWIVVGKGANALIRCGSYKRTCPVGEDCAEPKAKTVKAAAVEPVTPKPKIVKEAVAPLDALRAALRKEATKYEHRDAFDVALYNRIFTPSGKLIAATDIAALNKARMVDTSRNPYTAVQQKALDKYGLTSPFDTVFAQEAVKETGHKNLRSFWDMTVTTPTEPPTAEPVRGIRNKIIKVVTDIKPETIEQLAKRFTLTKDEITTIVSSMADDNSIAIRMQRGGSPLVVLPDYAAQLMDYEKHILREVKATPNAGTGDIMHKLFLDEVFVKQALLDMESDKVIKVVPPLSEVGPHVITITAKGKKSLARSGIQPKREPETAVKKKSEALEPVAPEPKADRWMEERPFTKDDTNRYNAFTFHPIDDLNNEFTGMVKPKLDEVDRLMKKYEVKEIPEEVQTGLMWYRRRTYEYLNRMIYSRLNAPGSFVVGPSNYNVKKHNKTIAGDQKFVEALDVSGRKLDTAINKTIIRRTTGKKAVAVSDREKWEATAVVTKRNKFGNMAETDFIENLKKKPKEGLTDHDKTMLDPKSTFRTQIRVEGRNLHARLIAEAFDRGVTISPEVLAEYPDLARPKIDLTSEKYSWSHTPWRKWEERKPPILLNPEHGIPDGRAYIVQDRSQRKSSEQGWDYSMVDAFPIEFDGAKSITMIIHKSTKVPSTFDVSYVPTGSVIAAQSNPLDSKSKAVGVVRDWIAEDPDGFISRIERPSKERMIHDYPHFRDMYKNLNAAKANKRKSINVHQVKETDLEDLSGIGAALQAASALYSLARIAL